MTGGGGAIYVSGFLTETVVTVANSLFYRNRAENGGAIYNLFSQVNIDDSYISLNWATESGGGLYGIFNGQFEIDGTTISDNTAETVRGGGVYIREGSGATVTNSTISTNLAAGANGTADDAGNGGGIYVGAISAMTNTLSLNNVTVVGNNAAGSGGGIDFNRLDSGDQITLTNTILAGNSDTGGYPDCYDNETTGYTLTLDGYNLLGGASGDVCGEAAGASDLSLETLGLTIADVISADGLVDNGGVTAGSSLGVMAVVPTHALANGSPAVDAGNNVRCMTVDQRGFPRPVDHDGNGEVVCDIGAFEAGQAIFKLFLPIVQKPGVPDLVVESVTLSADDVEIVIKNQGTGPTSTDFWVDIYINPDQPPTLVNETWEVYGGEGIVWGISGISIGPDETVTLNLSSVYFSEEHSNFSGTIALGAQMYAHADAANVSTAHGNVWEDHELSGGAYNNIISFTATTAVSAADKAE